MLKTKYEEIVDVKSIGLPINPIKINDLLAKAGSEELSSTKEDQMKGVKQVLLLLIDLQNDFEERGSLGVPKSHGDIERLTKWMYENMVRLSKVAFSLDFHNPFQIFFACWWIGKDGKNPPPFTVISLQDLDSGKWTPIIEPIWSREYVMNLEKQGKYKLFIWPYHCIAGTYGSCLEGQLGNMIYFHSVAKKSLAKQIVKGSNPKTEMYGILRAEYDPLNKINIEFLNAMENYSAIVIAGEAKSHCVKCTIEQILDHFKADIDMTKKIYILEDCMSSIPGFEADTDAAFSEFKAKHKVNIVRTDNFDLGGI